MTYALLLAAYLCWILTWGWLFAWVDTRWRAND